MQFATPPSSKSIAIAISALIALPLLMYAVIYPMNGAPAEQWVAVYFSSIGQLYDPTIPIRTLGTTHQILTEWILPGNIPARAVVYVLLTISSSIVLFHMVRRLSNNLKLAFLVAMIFTIYVPYNQQISRHFFVYVQNYTVLNMVASCAFLVETMKTKSRMAWLYLIVGIATGVSAIASYEGTIPVLGIFPIVLLLIPNVINRRNLVFFIIYAIGLGLAVIRFLNHLLFNFDSSYQAAIAGDSHLIPSDFILGIQRLYQENFQFEPIITPTNNYLLPSLLITLVALCAFLLVWRQDHKPLASVRELGFLFILGLLFIGLGGFIWAITGFSFGVPDRAYYFVQPGQALFVASILGFITVGLNRLFKIPQVVILLSLVGVLFMSAAHWFLDAQLFANNVNRDFHRFDQQLILYQELVSLAPEVEQETFFILICPTPHTVPQHFWFGNEKVGAVYLYEDKAYLDTDTFINFEDNHIRWEFEDAYPFIVKSYSQDRNWDYEQIILVECYDEKLRIVEHLPADQIPEGLDVSAYHPYRRIIDGFLPPERSRIFRW